MNSGNHLLLFALAYKCATQEKLHSNSFAGPVRKNINKQAVKYGLVIF